MNKLKKKIIEINNKVIISVFIYPKIKIDKKIKILPVTNCIEIDNKS